MDGLERARGILGMEQRRVARAEVCERLHDAVLDGGSHEMLSAVCRAVMPGGGAWTVDACERLRATLIWLLGAGMPEIQAMGADVGKHSMSGHGGPQIGSQGFEEVDE